jgi:GntR family transcriptional regulator, transcriptional repressor for pyruvate dehydrogenase complex
VDRPHNKSLIRIPKAAELVADTLRRRIILREYRPGELLPPEGTLMDDFDVARTTIRDAFRVLESEGLVEVRRGAGGGGRVRAPGVGMVSSYAALLLQFDGATLADVHLGRTLIEAPAAALLAELPDRAAVVDALHQALSEEQDAADAEALTVAEGRFHRLVVESTGNRVLVMLSAVANRLIAEQVARSLTKGAPSGTHAGFTKAHRAHERLVERIEAGDGPGAEALWRQHLESGKKHLASSAGAPTTIIDLMP